MPCVLLTNDDGIDAPGLAALARAVAHLGPATVAAPSEVWSCKGHAITTGEPIGWSRRPGGWYSVAGTPADCVRLGLHHFQPASEWVIAGINAGANLGADLFHSGTAAAAREAVAHGRPGVAFSQYIRRELPLDWDRAAAWTLRVLDWLLARPWSPGSFWSVNFPHLPASAPEPEIVRCQVDPSPLPLDFEIDGQFARYRGNYHGRARLPGHDVEHCFAGRITVSRVRLVPSHPDDLDDPAANPSLG